MRFREQRHVDRGAAGLHVAVAQLVGEDRLAAARHALQDVDAGAEEAAAEHDVEPGNAAGKSLEHRSGGGWGSHCVSLRTGWRHGGLVAWRVRSVRKEAACREWTNPSRPW